jgi:hypothetical protein
MRAMVWVMAVGAAMGGGCAPETGDVFSDVDGLQPAPERCTADADCGPGVRCGSNKVCAVLTPVECSAAEDCPRLECHDGPMCMGGVCVSVARTYRTTCHVGVCNGAGDCLPCVSDAECESVNASECYALVCDAGICIGRQREEGAVCTHGIGVCDPSATCIN